MSRVILFLANGFEDYAASAVIDKNIITSSSPEKTIIK